MPSLTMGLLLAMMTHFESAVYGVIFMRPNKQVVWIDTPRMIAVVADAHPIRDRLRVVGLPRETMCANHFALESE